MGIPLQSFVEKKRAIIQTEKLFQVSSNKDNTF